MRYWSWLLKSPSITQSVNQKLLIILKNKRKCQNENTQAHNYHENPPGLLWFSPHMPLIIASGENNFFFSQKYLSYDASMTYKKVLGETKHVYFAA